MRKYIEMMQRELSDPARVTTELLQDFLGKTLILMSSVRERIRSADPEEKEAGMKDAIELRQVFEAQVKLVGGLLPKVKKKSNKIHLIG